MTETERERIAGREDVEDIKRYQAISRVRRRIEDELTLDIAILEQHHEGLLDELRDTICPDEEDSKGDDIAEFDSSDPKTDDDLEPSETWEDTVTEEQDVDDLLVESSSAAGGVDEETRSQLREELAGSGDLLDARVGEVLKMYDHLREHGSAEKDDLLDVVNVETAGYASRNSVWSNMVKGKDTLRTLPGVQKPASGRTEWTYTGESDE